MKLTIELVPRTSWYDNVRSNVSDERWKELRTTCYNKAGHKCEICGETGIDQGYGHKVECHEIWEYDEYKHTQTLKGLIALCPTCHKVKHAGLAEMNGERSLVLGHLVHVNKMNKMDAIDYLNNSFVTWQERSVFEWTVDISYLSNHQNQLSKLLSTMNKFRKK